MVASRFLLNQHISLSDRRNNPVSQNIDKSEVTMNPNTAANRIYHPPIKSHSINQSDPGMQKDPIFLDQLVYRT